jgi:choline transport protein
MDTSKEELEVNKSVVDDIQIVEKDTDDGGIPSRYRGTATDKRDMMVLGKKQVLRVSEINQPHRLSSWINLSKRNFKFITMLGFASTVTASWEFLLP